MVQAGFPGAEMQKPEKKGFALFKKKEAPAGPSISDVLEQIGTIDRRLRIIESRNTDLDRKVQVTDKNMLGVRKRFVREIKTIDSDILEIKRHINELKHQIDLIANELKTCARKEDLDALSKYIELWEPVNFVTREEVEKIVKDALQNK